VNDTPSTVAVLEQLERLTATYGKPFGQAVKKQAEEYAAAFCRVGLPMVAVRMAVDESISLGKKFPSAAELIERARPHVPQTDGERQRSAEHCLHCGVLYFYAGYQFEGYEPRGHQRDSRPRSVLPKVRCGCPQDDPSWWTDDALGWVETDSKFSGMRKPRDYATNPRYRERPVGYRSSRSGEPTRAV
jgi:hypothetical protein